jgi:hypothetical protein
MGGTIQVFMSAIAQSPEWELAHREIVSLAAQRAAQDHALCRALLRAHRARVWRALGMATFFEYAARFAGLSARKTEDRLRVARALERLPLIDGGLCAGKLHFTAVRELARVADSETEAEWLAATDGKSVAEIERLVSHRQPGDRPDDPPRPEAHRHKIFVDVSADIFATFREAQAKVRRDSGEPLSDEEVLLVMARTVLEGPKDPGRSSYQVSMTVCERCSAATQDGRGEAIPIEPAVAETSLCDAQEIDARGYAHQAIPPATRRKVVKRQHGKCAVPACGLSVFTDIHHLRLRSEGGDNDADNLILICAAHHRAIHRGALWVGGTVAGGLTFRHADGSIYGAPADPRAAGLLSEVHQALRTLGFKESEVRSMVQQMTTHVGVSSTVEDVLRRALRATPARA